MNQRLYRKILPNKMRVLMIPIESTDTVAIGIFIKVGSRYENVNTCGIAHFLEHMMFKGTKHMHASTLSEKLDSVGAKYNAETSHESTNYYIYGHKDDTELFIKIISDLYLNPLFKEEDIIIEKGVVIEELNMVKDNPDEQIHEFLFEHIFKNSSLKYPIIGTKKNILSFDKKMISDFRKHFYVPERTVFVVSGNFNKNKIYKLIKKIFKNIKKSDSIITIPLLDPHVQIEPNMTIIKKNIAQTNLIISFKSHSIFSSNSDVYDLISDILSSGSSSRLFVLLRNKLGAVYFCNAYNMSFIYEGVFSIHIGADNKRVDEVIKKTIEEISKMTKNGVTQSELDKAKKIRITSFAVGLQTPQDFMAYYGSQELIYHIDDIPEFKKDFDISVKCRIKDYELITLNTINKTINDLFSPENLNIFVYGRNPIKNNKKLSECLM
jgi:predicted Zn-dependent peptidase